MAGENGNGDGRMRQLARSEIVTAWARLSMLTGPPIIAALVGAVAWFLAGMSADIKEAARVLAEYKTAATAKADVAASELKDHNRRIGNLESKVFGFSPVPTNTP
jgi:hypothetical protein